jgi:hypothetical protein
LRALAAAAEASSVRQSRLLPRPSPLRVAEAALAAAIVLLWLFFPVSPYAGPVFDALGSPTPTPYEMCVPPVGYTVCGSELQKLYPRP